MENTAYFFKSKQIVKYKSATLFITASIYNLFYRASQNKSTCITSSS